MKERPILFSGAMVRALLDGTKTQTRRAMKQQPIADRRFVGGYYIPATRLTPGQEISVWAPYVHIACPYGQPGDRLWVRETFAKIDGQTQPWIETDYRATYTHGDRLGDTIGIKKRWTPSIHMPRHASRITLEISSVRVERLQDISEEDADAECFGGRYPGEVLPELFPGSPDRWSHLSMAQCFGRLWESINPAEIPLLDDDGKKVGVQKNPAAWDANPWVWVIEFKRPP